MGSRGISVLIKDREGLIYQKEIRGKAESHNKEERKHTWPKQEKSTGIEIKKGEPLAMLSLPAE